MSSHLQSQFLETWPLPETYRKDLNTIVSNTFMYRCIILSIRLLKYISSTVLPQNLKLPLFFKYWASIVVWAEKREIQILRNTVEDMYFKSRILKIIHLYKISISQLNRTNFFLKWAPLTFQHYFLTKRYPRSKWGKKASFILWG